MVDGEELKVRVSYGEGRSIDDQGSNSNVESWRSRAKNIQGGKIWSKIEGGQTTGDGWIGLGEGRWQKLDFSSSSSSGHQKQSVLNWGNGHMTRSDIGVHAGPYEELLGGCLARLAVMASLTAAARSGVR